MPLADLTEAEKQVVRTCLEVVAAGDVLLHDSEFHTVVGVTPAEVQAVLKAWPDVDDSDELVWSTINNSFNNLLGYPHHFHDRWAERIPAPKEEVRKVFQKWRGERPGSYFEPWT